MGILIPENTTRKLDGLGRITLPKGLRDRLSWKENDDIEFFTANIEGRMCVCLTPTVDEDVELENAVRFLEERGYVVSRLQEDGYD